VQALVYHRCGRFECCVFDNRQHLLSVNGRNSTAARFFVYDDIARKQQARCDFLLQGVIGQPRIKDAENDVFLAIGAELFLKLLPQVDLKRNPNPSASNVSLVRWSTWRNATRTSGHGLILTPSSRAASALAMGAMSFRRFSGRAELLPALLLAGCESCQPQLFNNLQFDIAARGRSLGPLRQV
jgi:hypothetical protein